MSHHYFTFISDPGHGWLRVPLSLIVELGVEQKISPYSYMQGEIAFLEEACDAPLFYEALTKAGNSYTVTRKYEDNTPIRHYQCFSVEPRQTVESALAERFSNGEMLSGKDLEVLFIYHHLWNGLQAKTKSWVRKFLTGASIRGTFKSTCAPLTGLRLEAFNKALKALSEIVSAAPGQPVPCHCCKSLKTDTRKVDDRDVCSACLAKIYFRCTDCREFHLITERKFVPGWVGIELCPTCRKEGMGRHID